jgi:hypothetical protein
MGLRYFITNVPTWDEYELEYRYRNCVDHMHERRFTTNQLVEYTKECLDNRDLDAIEALARILKQMEEGDCVWICSE